MRLVLHTVPKNASQSWDELMLLQESKTHEMDFSPYLKNENKVAMVRISDLYWKDQDGQLRADVFADFRSSQKVRKLRETYVEGNAVTYADTEPY